MLNLENIDSNYFNYLVIFQVGVINKRHITYGTRKILLLLFGTIHWERVEAQYEKLSIV